mmetsp:Transcript_26648/g.27692  ORF Transcript_26648/g.27692 Transcript_26648/m.27692 type:complete len:287 (+) Transcript_26648:3-863(+)
MSSTQLISFLDSTHRSHTSPSVLSLVKPLVEIIEEIIEDMAEANKKEAFSEPKQCKRASKGQLTENLDLFLNHKGSTAITESAALKTEESCETVSFNFGNVIVPTSYWEDHISPEKRNNLFAEDEQHTNRRTPFIKSPNKLHLNNSNNIIDNGLHQQNEINNSTMIEQSLFEDGSLLSYMTLIIKETKPEKSTLVLTMIYMERFFNSKKVKTGKLNIKQTMFVSFLLALKMNEDVIYKISVYIDLGGINEKDYIESEKEFLDYIDYNLHVKEDLYEMYSELIDIHP